MADFYDESVLGIKRLPSKDSGQTFTCDVTTPKGTTVATMRIGAMETKFKVLKALGFIKFVAPIDIEVVAPSGKVILRIQKGFSMKDYVATLQDEQRRVVATLKRSTTATGTDGNTYDYKLSDPSNSLIALVRGNWRLASQLQVLDERGGALGKVSRKDAAMGPNHPLDERFHVVNLYSPPQSASRRLALMGTLASMDLLVD